MPSVKSYFNKTLFLKNLTRFWPIWALYGIIWVFALPVNLLLNINGSRTEVGYLAAEFAHRTVYDIAGSASVLMSAFFGLLAAMAVCSYLYGSRSAGFFHALPVRREGLFLTSYLSGLCFFLIPNAAVFLITLAAEGAAGAVNLGALAVWFFTQLLCLLFFYSFGIFCGMFTGHILALPVFYGVLNFLASAIYYILMFFFETFLYGFVSSPALERTAGWLTPAFKLTEGFFVRTAVELPDPYLPPTAETYYLSGLGYALIYAAVGILLAALALAVYRRRQLETAGDIVTVRWVKPVFKYGLAACAAITFGAFLYEVFSYTLPQGAWTLFIFMAICGVIGYFAAEMLLQKSFRVFGKWKGCVVFLVCLALFTAALELDLAGFEKRVPDPARVVSAQISDLDTAPYDSANYRRYEVTDPENIALLIQIHQGFVDRQEELEDYEHRGTPALAYGSFRITYRLSDGSTLSRRYSYRLMDEGELKEPGSLAALLDRFVNLPANVRAAYRLDEVDPNRLAEAQLTLWAGEGRGYLTKPILAEEEVRRLWDAVQLDFAAGTLGRRYLFDNSAERMENTCLDDLYFFYLQREDEDGNLYTSEVQVTLTPNASHTIAALEELGLITGAQDLTTHAEQRALEEAEVSAHSEALYSETAVITPY